MIFKSRKDFDCQFDWLFYLQNDLGYNDLKICCNYFKDGELRFSKWYNFLELQYQENSIDIINKATHRSILDIEIVYDIDEIPKGYNSIKDYAISIHKELDKLGQQHFVYFTGNKSYHIHIFDERLRDRINKLNDIKKYAYNKNKTDGLKFGNSMIALEGAKHYKSGKEKIEVEANGFT